MSPASDTEPGVSSRTALATGKLSAELLQRLVLGRLGARRSETIVGAALGVDAAALAVDDGWAVVLTSDPITTASAGAGRLAVHVVCNDLATMGAEPIGVLATLLFPAGVEAAAVGELAAEIDQTCRALNVEVLGGHTEVAPAVVAPLVVMSGVGKVRRDRLLTAAGGRPGDALVLTKAAGLEGTHILAHDFAVELAHVTQAVLDEARGYATELSVVREARLAAACGASAMHDPTEGGILGAVWEMAEASGCGCEVEAEAIPVREPTRVMCAALGADPLRLIASGALLIACGHAPRMIDALAGAGIAAHVIGRLTAEPERRLRHPDGRIESLAMPPRDELYRLLAERQA